MAEKSKPPALRVVGDSGDFGPMRRDTLELADNSLFIETSEHSFAAAQAHLPSRRCRFSKKGAFGFDPTPFQTAGLLPDCDTDTITIAGAPLVPLIWKDHLYPGEIQNTSTGTLLLDPENRDYCFLHIDNLNFIYVTLEKQEKKQ